MITIDLNQQALSEEVEALLAGLKDFTPLLKRLGTAAHEIWSEKFRSQGPGWQPLAEVTLAKRRKNGRGAEILKDGGQLFASLTDSASEGSVYELSSKALTIGTNFEYAAVHQFGSKDGKIPKRAFLPDASEVAPEFELVIQQYFERLSK